MNNSRSTTAGIMLDIAKGWKPNMYLSNMSMAFFQEEGMYVAPSIFPICPVATSIFTFHYVSINTGIATYTQLE